MVSLPGLQRGSPSILYYRPTDTKSPSSVQIQKTWQQLQIHLIAPQRIWNQKDKLGN